jgi:hypothetical protein
LIRKVSTMLAAAGSVAFLVGSMGLTGTASAASLPSCATGVRCTTFTATPGSITEPGGVAGYYGADDNHTHFRFAQTTVSANPQLIDLNGPLSSEIYPATTGVDLCDPNDGITAQISLGYWDNEFQVGYYVGKGAPASDPCTQDNLVAHQINIFKVGTLLGLVGINPGDKVYLGIYYTPSGKHQHQLSFGACDETTGVCRQAYTSSRFQLEFWEFGVGTFLPVSVLTGGADNEFETFTATDVTCYSCAHMVPISSVAPVNSFGAGGLYESQTANSSSQVVLSPKDSLSGDTFSEWNGSTSI